MDAPPRWPQEGDIVVRQEQRDGRWVFLLQSAPGPDQYVLPTRDAAVTEALAFAKRQRVRAWLSDGSSAFTLMEDFRVTSQERIGSDGQEQPDAPTR